jgi:GT2 family glycosyltransferase
VGPVALSVVIGTRDRADTLVRCLAALKRSDIELDVVVVDDRSRNPGAVREVAEAAGARLVESDGAGVSAARNRGVALAKANFVAFTDDDCEPRPNWARALVERLSGGESVVYGTTVAGNGTGRLAAASQLAANALLDARFVTAPASNVACLRSIAVEVPFDESFIDLAGEERDWFARITRAGYALVSEPRAVVVHHQALTLSEFWRKHVRYGRGAYRYRHRYEDGRLESPRFYAGLLAASFRRGPAVGVAVCVAQAATGAGYVLEATRRT